MKMMLGACSRAITNSSRTMRLPSPMYFCTSSEPETRMKVQSVWCATARASSVLPVPTKGGALSARKRVSLRLDAAERAWRPVQQHALGLRDAERVEELWVLDGQLHNLLDLLDLRVQPAHHVVGAVRHLLHLHEAHQRVHLARQQHVQRVAVVAQRHARGGLHGGDVDALVALNHVLAFGMHLRARRRSDRTVALAHQPGRERSATLPCGTGAAAGEQREQRHAASGSEAQWLAFTSTFVLLITFTTSPT